MTETKFTVGVGTALSGAVGHSGEEGQGYNEEVMETGLHGRAKGYAGGGLQHPWSGLDLHSGVHVKCVG